MSFDPLKITALTKKIIALPDQPNMQPDELKQYFDSSPMPADSIAGNVPQSAAQTEKTRTA